VLCTGASSLAATIAVNTGTDSVANDGLCSLREAITAANLDTPSGGANGECAAGSADDTIDFPAGPYSLTRAGAGEDSNDTGDLDVLSNVTISGAGRNDTTINGGQLDRVIHVAVGNTVVIEDVTITGGQTPDAPDAPDAMNGANGSGSGAGGDSNADNALAGGDGGGILNAGTLTVRTSRIASNTTGDGGEGGTSGTGGTGGSSGGFGGAGRGGDGGRGGGGGGIASSGTLNVIDSEVSDNTTGDGGAGGGGFGGQGGSNAAGVGGSGGSASGGDGGGGGRGGGIYGSLGVVSLTRTRVAGNTTGAGAPGGQAFAGNGGTGGGSSGGGFGGGALSGPGGSGGEGGGVATEVELNLSDSTITDNSTGAGASSGPAAGGIGGTGGGSSGPGGGGGAGNSQRGGQSGAAGVFAGGELSLSGTTIDRNSGGDAGAGGQADGGNGGNGGLPNGNGGDGGSGNGGDGGATGGGGIGLLTNQGMEAVNSTVTLNAIGSGGDGERGFGGMGGAGVGTGNGGDGGNGNGGRGGDALGGGIVQEASATSTARHLTISNNNPGPAGFGDDGDGGDPGAGSPSGAPGDSNDGGDGFVGAGGVALGFASFNTFTLQNSIVAANAGAGCSGSVILDGDHNLSFPDTSCPGTNADPALGALTDNGGPALTQALGPGSAALDQVPAAGAGCAATDQRGVSRPQGSGCEVGAYEKAPPDAVTGSATGLTAVGATLTGTVNPNRRATTYRFEFGTTTAYGTSTQDADAGAGGSEAPAAAAVSGLAPSTLYHYRLVATNADGTSFGADATFTTTPAGVPPDVTAPVISAVRVRKRKIRYRLSEDAAVTITFQRARPGRRKGKRCVKPSAARRGARKCTRFVARGTLRRSGTAGANTVSFSGRVRRKRLAPGKHRAVLRATDAANNRSKPVKARFRIVRR
jgi:CSLREA domain-containing protein